ncbi:uncharacterized protein LOC131380669 [Hylobates moloch]|uniref:uncharacterized protein LOC131380669 n=1 Tax=Hylobates moloch TaxID=81572 RepID=UPI0026770AB6|nr:uncharacterized protein LOC131380669 [Hylobates moloch]
MARNDRTSASRVQTPSPTARLLLPPAPPRHLLNGDSRACACAARAPSENCLRAGAERARAVVRPPRFPSSSAAQGAGPWRPALPVGRRRGQAEAALASGGVYELLRKRASLGHGGSFEIKSGSSPARSGNVRGYNGGPLWAYLPVERRVDRVRGTGRGSKSGLGALEASSQVLQALLLVWKSSRQSTPAQDPRSRPLFRSPQLEGLESRPAAQHRQACGAAKEENCHQRIFQILDSILITSEDITIIISGEHQVECLWVTGRFGAGREA